MKTGFVLFVSIMLMVMTSCNNQEDNSKNNGIDKASTENSSSDRDQNLATGSGVPEGMENILGEWTLDRTLRDDNGNHKIDENEEKTAIVDPGGYMKLNGDGTCKFQSVMDGTYEIVTAEDGRKRLAITDLAGSKYPVSQYIVSVTDKELVINNIAGGSNFDVYKRP